MFDIDEALCWGFPCTDGNPKITIFATMFSNEEADIWSKRGLSSSYQGVMAHFSHKDHGRHCVVLVLAVRQLHLAHCRIYQGGGR